MITEKRKYKCKLTPKQEMFCQEYMVDLNATQAAIRAGYSSKTANEQGAKQLAKSSIRYRIGELKEKRISRVEVTADYVLTTIVETIERCKQASPVLDRKGDPVTIISDNGELKPIYEFEPGSVLKGAELLGKHLAMWTDKQRIEGFDGSPLPPFRLIVEKGASNE